MFNAWRIPRCLALGTRGGSIAQHEARQVDMTNGRHTLVGLLFGSRTAVASEGIFWQIPMYHARWRLSSQR